MHYRYLIFLLLLISACKKDTVDKKIEIKNDKLFTLVNPKDSNLKFINSVVETNAMNFLNYPYIYIGGGVAVGDINNDGLKDIYFTSNQGNNKLYLNQGNFQFIDITETARVSDNNGWSSGVSMIDINNDGWLDIYVCKSGSLNNNELRRNKLFINQKDNTFKEQAKDYGLDHPGFSTQAYFFDFDKDEDLDIYLVNHRADFSNNATISSEIQRAVSDFTSDHLFRNNGNNTFTKVTQEAGMVNKSWGLSASIGDFNNDGWDDVYVANDYLEPDKLYINNKDGTFKNEILERFKHISFYSMGSDIADINNDLKPDLLVLDMSAEDHARGKENMATMSTANFNSMVQIGYHHQYMSNMLQLNNGNGSFSDIGQLAGISKTDWSWAPLIADFDNDGYKDIFVTNGIEKDVTNQDFKRKLANISKQGKSMVLDTLLKMMPADKLPNYIYKNNGDLTFSKMIEEWGLNKRVNSNGSAYADLDNDGDLDLIINNENAVASIYKNNSNSNYLQISLLGADQNKFAIGSKVRITTDNLNQLQELYVNRGFQSSVTNVLNFGVNQVSTIDEIEVTWPDGKISLLNNVESNQLLTLNYKDAIVKGSIANKTKFYFEEINPEVLNILYKHEENNFNDFDKQLLLPQKQSTQGPCVAVGDVNGDKLDDFYVGGGANQAAQLYIQNKSGSFDKLKSNAFESDKNHEDTGALFFDADNDNDLDLFVTSSGYDLDEKSNLLQDRLYTNDGRGNFSNRNVLPKMISSTKAVKSLDFDNDGDLDLIVGGRVIPGQYPLAPRSFVLENANGRFTDVTQEIAPEFANIGMVNAIEIADYDNDGNTDVIVVGLWMPIKVFAIRDGKFEEQVIPEFEKTEGWYQSLTSSDIDNDGDLDFVIGNIGANNKFHPSLEKPLHIFSGNFDDDNSYDFALSKDYKGQLVPVRGKECSSEQTPYLNEKIGTYKEFASLNIEGIYGTETIENSNHLMAYNFKSLFLENLGNGDFNLHKLPNEAQIGPTLDFEIIDINADGYNDIIGVGNLYDAEVETVRYDASQGYVLLNNGNNEFTYLASSGLNCNSDMRSINSITIGGVNHVIVSSNNDVLSIFKLLKK